MAPELTLMAVHAHPDDEAIATGGVLAKAAAEGIRTVVVTCTNGDYGDGPGGVKPGEEGHDPEQVVLTRRAELEEACRRLGVANLELLGYHDSGMAAWTYKEQPGVFARVPVAEAASRLGALFEAYRPDAVVTYEQDAAYDHPDHVQAARITLAAMDLVPVARKLYLTAFNTRRWEQLETLLRERGIELPFPDPTPEWQERLARSQQQITTLVDVRPWAEQKQAAVRAHASQMNQSFFMKLPADLLEIVLGEEAFIRHTDRTGAPVPETDLFAGLR
jgi:LmbE family N-acetylglucosaminyl deacetylase